MTQNRDQVVGFGALLVPFSRACPASGVVEAVVFERTHPFGFGITVEGTILVVIVIKNRPGVITDNVLNNFDAFTMRKCDEVFVVLHAAVAGVGVFVATVQRARGGQVWVNV